MSDALTTTNDEFLAAMAEAQDQIDDTPIEYTAPLIMFHHGVKGGQPPHFFIKLGALDTAPGAPWTPYTNVYDEQGYMAEAIEIAPITAVERWGTEDGESETYTLDYVPGARSNYRILCFAKGVAGVCILCGRGTHKGGALRKILMDHKRGPIAAAKQATKGKVAMHTFWLTIGTARDAKGKPIYIPSRPTEPSSSAVTPPVAIPTDAPLATRFVGKELLLLGTEMIVAMADALPPRAREPRDEAGDELPALPAGRNVPQPLTEAEYIIDESVPF